MCFSEGYVLLTTDQHLPNGAICHPSISIHTMSELHQVSFLSTVQQFVRALVATDVRTAIWAFLYLGACMLVMALFLQLPISRCRAPRAAFGLMLASTMLITHPKIYASDTQMMGLTLACYCCELAWTILHWTFLEAHRKPTVMEVCASPFPTSCAWNAQSPPALSAAAACSACCATGQQGRVQTTSLSVGAC
jgi:hypothetical protein